MKLLFTLLFSFSAWGYVPTVESIFRNGSNPDITQNVANLRLKITKTDPSGVISESSNQTSDYFRIILTKFKDETIKLNQLKLENESFDESVIAHKSYFSNFSTQSLAGQSRSVEKSIFYGIIKSLVLNEGDLLVRYLKSQGGEVFLNKEIINRQKIELLAQYKQYLVTINKDKEARKTLENPLRPNDVKKREEVDRIMNESMYIDTKQVVLAKNDGEMNWVVDTGAFKASVSYAKRHLNKITYKGETGDLEFVFKDYALVNATHVLPRQILIRDFNGDNYQVDIVGLSYSNLSEDGYVKKLRDWDKALKEQDVEVIRPGFML